MKPKRSVGAVLLAAGGGTRFVGSTHKLLAPLGGLDPLGNKAPNTSPRPGAQLRVFDHALAAVQAAGFEQVAIVAGAVRAAELWPGSNCDSSRNSTNDSTNDSTKPDLTGSTPHGLQHGLVVLHNDRWADGIATSLQTAIGWAAELGLDAIVVGLADQPFIETQAWLDIAAAIAQDGPHQIAIATYGETPGNPVGLKKAIWPSLPKTGDEGARQLIRSHNELCLPVACQGTPNDIDTVEDLERWT